MTNSDRFAHLAFGGARTRRGGVWSPVVALAGLLATGVAVAIGAILAVFTAAVVAVIALIAGVVMFLTGFGVRARRNARPQPADGVIEAHKVGETWVAYGWERQGQ
jgi:heme/copper-type cytochrome/quinol oxidase subunit 2